MLLVVVLAVVVVGGAVLLLGGGDDDSGAGGGGSGGGGGDPVAAVRAYLDAATASDCGALAELMTASSRAMLGAANVSEAEAACEAELAGGGEVAGAGVTIAGDPVVVSNDGETAVVELAATADGDTETTQVTLRLEDGAWKIDLTAIGGSASSSPAPPGDEADANQSGGGAAGP